MNEKNKNDENLERNEDSTSNNVEESNQLMCFRLITHEDYIKDNNLFWLYLTTINSSDLTKTLCLIERRVTSRYLELIENYRFFLETCKFIEREGVFYIEYTDWKSRRIRIEDTYPELSDISMAQLCVDAKENLKYYRSSLTSICRECEAIFRELTCYELYEKMFKSTNVMYDEHKLKEKFEVLNTVIKTTQEQYFQCMYTTNNRLYVDSCEGIYSNIINQTKISYECLSATINRPEDTEVTKSIIKIANIIRDKLNITGITEDLYTALDFNTTKINSNHFVAFNNDISSNIITDMLLEIKLELLSIFPREATTFLELAYDTAKTTYAKLKNENKGKTSEESVMNEFTTSLKTNKGFTTVNLLKICGNNLELIWEENSKNMTSKAVKNNELLLDKSLKKVIEVILNECKCTQLEVIKLIKSQVYKIETFDLFELYCFEKITQGAYVCYMFDNIYIGYKPKDRNKDREQYHNVLGCYFGVIGQNCAKFSGTLTRITIYNLILQYTKNANRYLSSSKIHQIAYAIERGTAQYNIMFRKIKQDFYKEYKLDFFKSDDRTILQANAEKLINDIDCFLENKEYLVLDECSRFDQTNISNLKKLYTPPIGVKEVFCKILDFKSTDRNLKLSFINKHIYSAITTNQVSTDVKKNEYQQGYSHQTHTSESTRGECTKSTLTPENFKSDFQKEQEIEQSELEKCNVIPSFINFEEVFEIRRKLYGFEENN